MASGTNKVQPPLGRPYDYNTGKVATSQIDLWYDQTGDTELRRQPHLAWLGNMTAVWKDYTGKGVHVGVYDEGVQKIHWDLDGNYDSSRNVRIFGQVDDGQPASGFNGHGTSVAGLIAAERNGRGGVGVAYDSGITGVGTLTGGPADVNGNFEGYLLSLRQMAGRFDVTNHSYGINWGIGNYMTSDYDRQRVGTTAWYIDQALGAATDAGRDGLGSISVFASANADHDGQYLFGASRHAVAVAAFRQVDGNSSSYSNYGSHLLVSAPSNDYRYLGGTGLVTTDMLGVDGYNMYADPANPADYTDSFGGTSGAAPIVTGVVSLMLDANENLGWRDVKNILAASAKMPLAFETGPTTMDVLINGERGTYLLNNSQFKLGGDQGNWNGGAMHYSIDYGYGAVDAYNAVRMSEVWGLFNTPQYSGNEVHATVEKAVGLTAAGTNTTEFDPLRIDFDNRFLDKPVEFKFTVQDDIALEHVDLQFDYTQIIRAVRTATGEEGTKEGTLYLTQFKLTAPDGTETFLGESGSLAPKELLSLSIRTRASPSASRTFAAWRARASGSSSSRSPTRLDMPAPPMKSSCSSPC